MRTRERLRRARPGPVFGNSVTRRVRPAGPRGLAAALAALTALLLTVLAAGCGETAPTPRTGFETRGGSSWTTLAEEQRFLAAVDSVYGDRARLLQVGRSVQGRPIQLLIVGSTLPDAEIATGSSILFVCAQHGNEPAGREGCLQQARDHAAGTSDAPMLVIPTANPDGIAADVRFNATKDRKNPYGYDVNRDHVALSTPEARTIARVQRTYRPDVTMDMHEYSDRHRKAGERVEYNFQRQTAIPSGIRTLSRELTDRWLVPAWRSATFPTGPYSTDEPTPETLLQTSGRRKSVGALVETPREGRYSRLQRVEAQRLAAAASLRFRIAAEDRVAANTR